MHIIYIIIRTKGLIITRGEMAEAQKAERNAGIWYTYKVLWVGA